MSGEFFGFSITQAKTLERLMGSDDSGLAALATSITNLNAWAAVLAAKLNADAGVTDTNYDTDPQLVSGE
jgi:hypothetical protein